MAFWAQAPHVMQSPEPGEDSEFEGFLHTRRACDEVAPAAILDLARPSPSDGSDDEDGVDFLSIGGHRVAAGLACVGAGDTDLVEVEAIAPPTPKRGQSSALRECLVGSHRSERSKAQHVALAEHMRAKKAERRRQQERANTAESLQVVAKNLQQLSVRRDSIVEVKAQRGGELCVQMADIGRLTDRAWLQLAFADLHSSTQALARRFSVDKNTVKSAFLLTAWTIMKIALALQTSLQERARQAPSQGVALWSAMWSLCWDESAKVLSHRIPMLSAQQRRSRWQVLVSLSSIDVIWAAQTSDHGEQLLHQVAHVPRPDIPMLNTTAECVLNALFECRLAKPYSDGALGLLREAEVSAIHCTMDGASANSKAMAWKLEEWNATVPKVLISVGGCSLHLTDLIKGLLLRLFLDLLPLLYSIAGLCAMGTNFMKVVYALPLVVEKNLKIFVGKPALCPEEEQYRRQLVEYIVCHSGEKRRHKRSKKAPATECAHGTETTTQQQTRRDVEKLLSVLNGSLSDGALVHWCDGPQCCDGYNRKATCGKVVRALIRVVFSRAPSSPEVGKWTKLGASLDTILVGFLVCRIASVVYPLAFSKGMQDSLSAHSSVIADHSFMQDMHWQTVMGKRAKDSIELVTNVEKNLRLLALEIASEPLRILTRVFMSLSSEYPSDHPKSHPALCSMVTDKYSPITAMLQYLSAMCSRDAFGRWVLLLRASQCASMKDFWAKHTLLALALRRCLLLVSSWIHARHYIRFNEFPWRLAKLGDPRLSEVERKGVVGFFAECRLCCIDEHFSRKLRCSGVFSRADELLQPKWSAFFRSWAQRVGVSNARVEWRHARQQRLAPSKGHGFANFCARSFCAEALEIHAQDQHLLAPVAVGGPSDEWRRRRRKRSIGATPMSAIHFFRKRFIRQQQAEGVVQNWCTAASWKQVQDAWGNEPNDSELKRLCLAEASESIAIARAKSATSRLSRTPAEESPLVPFADGGASGATALVAVDTVQGAMCIVPQQPTTPLASAFGLGFGCEGRDGGGGAPQPLQSWQLSEAQQGEVLRASWPFDVSNFGRMLLHTPESLKQSAAAAADAFSVVVSGKPLERRARYPSSCQGLCAAEAPDNLLALQGFFASRLEKWLRASKVQEQLFKVTVGGGGGEERSAEHWLLTAWSPSAGNFPFRASLMPADEASPYDRQVILDTYGEPPDWAPGAKIFLQRRRADFVELDREEQDPALRVAFAEPFVGVGRRSAFAHCSHHDFVAHVLRLAIRPCQPEVRLEPLAFAPVGFDCVATSGDVSGEVILVNEQSLQEHHKTHHASATGFLRPIGRRKRASPGDDVAKESKHDPLNNEDEASQPDELERLLELLIDEEERKQLQCLQKMAQDAPEATAEESPKAELTSSDASED